MFTRNCGWVFCVWNSYRFIAYIVLNISYFSAVNLNYRSTAGSRPAERDGRIHVIVADNIKQSIKWQQHTGIASSFLKYKPVQWPSDFCECSKKNGNVPLRRTSELNVIISACVPLWNGIIHGTLISLHLHQLNDFGARVTHWRKTC